MKKITSIILTGFIVALLLGCSGAKNEANKELKAKQFDELKEFVSGNALHFKADYALPMQTFAVVQVTNALLRNTGNAAGRIYVARFGDYLKIQDGIVDGDFSYYGEIRIGRTLDPDDNAIIFKGEPKKYEVIENEKKNMVSIEFEINAESETFSVTLNIYPNKRAYVNVASAYRTSIQYQGFIGVLEEEESASVD